MTVEVLCVDGDNSRRTETTAALERAGTAVREAATIVAAERALDVTVDCVVAEYELPDGSGIDLFDRVRRLAPDAACVLFSGVPIERMDVSATGEPIVEYVDATQPGAPERLRERVDHAVRDRHHSAYPLPTNEPARLAAIEACDRLTGSPTLDRLVDRAAGELSTPVALVGVVDSHRERMLATHGVCWEELHRQDTICAHAICESGVTVVEDIATDARFSRAAPVLDRGLRSYAGAPVNGPGGHTIGMLCVFDERTRQFTAGERATLRRLAAAVSDHLYRPGAASVEA